jgi:cytochrome c
MKRIFLVFCAASFIISCGNDSNNTASEGSGTGTTSGTTTTDAGTAAGTTTPAPATAATADVEKGLDLIAASDCLTCHKVEEKLVGPAYREIAAKYPNNQATIDTLSSRVINGASGNWGQLVMTPHPQISKEDAQTMVKYIMSLKQ